MIRTVSQMQKFVDAVTVQVGEREGRMVQFVFESYGSDEGRFNVANALLDAVKKGDWAEIKLAAYEVGFPG